jgi:hypothetical protein
LVFGLWSLVFGLVTSWRQLFLNADRADRADQNGSEKDFLIRPHPLNPLNPRSKKA